MSEPQGSVARPAEPVSPYAKWWPLVAVSLAIFMLLIDITVVNVALPNVQSDLHATFANLQWVINAYALTLASLQLTSGSLGDRLGRKRLFITGIALFAVASLGCGLAPSAAALDWLRALQGVGGAVMYSNSIALLSDNYAGRDRATAFGVWGAVSGASVAIGPLVGGALTTALGWRWIFFINLPLAGAAIVISALRLHAARPQSRRRIDWPGLVSFSAALVLLVYALVDGNNAGWSSPRIVAMLAGAAVVLIGFGIVELRTAHPMLELHLFRRPGFVGAQIGAFAISASLYSSFLYLTLYLQDVLGFSALQAGLRLLTLSVLSFIVAPLAGKLTDRVQFRFLISVALGFTGAGLLLMHGVTASSSWTALLAGFIVAGIGSGAINPPLGSLSVGVVPRESAGMGSGINITFRQVGIATGIATMGAVFQSRVTRSLTHQLPQLGTANLHQLGAAVSSGGFAQALSRVPAAARHQVGEAARTAFVSGLNELFLIGGGVALVGGAAALLLIRQRDVISGHDEAAWTPEAA
ncbi:MAG: MFS transporter [Acidimicrobiales bacterium]